MIDKIIAWLFARFLDWALEKVKREVDEAKQKHEQDKVDERNAKAYEEAKERADKIRRANDLLNGAH